MRPNARTPAGASIYLRRSRAHTIVSIDRWPISDATPAQCAAVQDLFIREFKEHIAREIKGGMSFLAQPSIWTGITTREREAEVLQMLIDIEGSDL